MKETIADASELTEEEIASLELTEDGFAGLELAALIGLLGEYEPPAAD